MKWLTAGSTLLLTSVSASNEFFPRFFYAEISPIPSKSKETEFNSSNEGHLNDQTHQFPYMTPDLKRKDKDSYETGFDMEFLGFNKDIGYLLNRSADNLHFPERPWPTLNQSTTPVVESLASDTFTSNTVNSSTSSMYDSMSESGSNNLRTLRDQQIPFSTAPVGLGNNPLGSGAISMTDSARNDFIGRTIFFDNPSRLFDNRFNIVQADQSISDLASYRSAIVATAASEGIADELRNSNDLDMELFLEKLCSDSGFNAQSFGFPVANEEANKDTLAMDLLDVFEYTSLNMYNTSTSPKALAYPFYNSSLSPLAAQETFSQFPRQRSLSSPLHGKSLVRIESQFEIKIPVAEPSPKQAFYNLDREYVPWLPPNTNEIFAPIDSETFKRTFGLDPFRDTIEAVEPVETEDNRKYFPPCFKPFYNYGEIPTDMAKMEKFLMNPEARRFCHEATDEVERDRAKKLNARYKVGAKSRHSVALEFATEAKKCGLIEGRWVHRILAGDTIEFFDVPFDFDSPTEPWTVTRGRKFITALVPSLLHSLHVEENLVDFLDEFFLDKVVVKACDEVISEADKIALSSELTKIAKEMIKYLISSAIFEKFISFVQPVILPKDAESLYETLVETMKTFKVPSPYKSSELTLPVCPAVNDIKYSSKKLRNKAAMIAAFNQDMEAYKKALDDYYKKVSLEKVQERFHSERYKSKKNQKNRSFEYIKILVHYLADPIMRPNSRWVNGSFLHMKKADTSESATGDSEEKESEESAKKKPKKSTSTDELIFGQNAHQNQDFFDALFFSRILRACLILDHTVSFISENLEPFFSMYKIGLNSSPIGFRYLKAINKFFFLTRFNVVANVHPQVISYRRYLAAYLCRNGAQSMGVEPSKVQARSVSMELFSLFEAINLFQVYGVSTLIERRNRFEVFLTSEEVSYQIPIIYLTYNLLNYHDIAEIIERLFTSKPDSKTKESDEISSSTEATSEMPSSTDAMNEESSSADKSNKESSSADKSNEESSSAEKSKEESSSAEKSKEESSSAEKSKEESSSADKSKEESSSTTATNEKSSKSSTRMGTNKLNAYFEIFAMAKNIDLYPILERKVLKFKDTGIVKGEEDIVYILQNINENMELRSALPAPYEAVYDWNMSRRLKNLEPVENHLKFPYVTFAVRMLLARRFGISFDASKFNAQFAENMTWLEGLGFANFFLEREAQFLIDKSYSKTLDSDNYQVYRVSDQQAFIHRARALASDEPTHHINVLINAGLDELKAIRSSLQNSSADARPSIDVSDIDLNPELWKWLFERYSKGLGMFAPTKFMDLPKSTALRILRFFLNESNRPESFRISNYPEIP